MARDKCPCWVTRSLGACRLPRPGDERRLSRLGVTMLVSLVEDEELYDAWPGGERELVEAMESAGIRVVRLPTPDFGAPDPAEACRVLGVMREEMARGGRVVIHCYAGIGRTGTLVVAYLTIMEGVPLEEALEMAASCGSGPQSEEQWGFLHYLPLQCGRRGEPAGEEPPHPLLRLARDNEPGESV